MAYQLILDTSNKELVVAIADETKILAKTQYSAWQKQSEYTMVEVEKLFQQLRLTPQDINRIIVANGPGSYTGVRIALTIAKVMASLLPCRLCVISSLAAIAGVKGKQIAIMDARSKRAYVGIYNEGKALQDDVVMSLEELQKVIESHPDYALKGDLQLLNREVEPIDYAQNLLELASIYDDVAEVDIVTPRYIKD